MRAALERRQCDSCLCDLGENVVTSCESQCRDSRLLYPVSVRGDLHDGVNDETVTLSVNRVVKTSLWVCKVLVYTLFRHLSLGPEVQ